MNSVNDRKWHISEVPRLWSAAAGATSMTAISEDNDVTASALHALQQAGARGLSAYQIATSVIEDRAIADVPWRDRPALGLDGINRARRSGQDPA